MLPATVSHKRKNPRAAMARTLNKASSSGMIRYTTRRRSRRRPLANASRKVEAGVSRIIARLNTSNARRSRENITIMIKAQSSVYARWDLTVGCSKRLEARC